MANATRTAGLLVVAALAAISGISEARTIPSTGPYEIKTSEPVVVITDSETQTDLETLDYDFREKRRER